MRLSKSLPLTFLFLLVVTTGTAHADVRQLVFEPPREATFRQKNGALGRGSLVSIDPLRVRLRLQNGDSKDVPLEQLQFIRTVDMEFSFKSSDDIQTIITNGNQLDDTFITNAPGEEPAMEETTPTANGGFGTSSNSNSGMMNNGGFGTAQPPTNNGGFGTGEPSNSGNLIAPGTIVICDNCKKEVSVTAEYGQNCPHCGIEWSLDLPQVSMTQPGNNATDDAGQAIGNVRRPIDPLNAAPNAAPPANLPPSSTPVAQEFSMATMPVWMKVGLFVFFTAVGYYMFFYRA